MRKWMLASSMASLGLVAGFAWAAWANAGPAAVPAVGVSPRAVGVSPRAVARDGYSTGMLAFSATLAEDRQQITIIDPTTRVMSVYHIEPKSGEIVLRAVRNVTWDLEMTVFNGTSPLPQEIRSQLQQR
ncbi:MAG: hypothetical protein WD875_07285 [Pirellulales bacterium]